MADTSVRSGRETGNPQAAAPSAAVERRLAAILAADVAGYSRLMAANEAATLATLKAHREVLDRSIAHHHGRIVGTAGDSLLAEFRSPVEAVSCAVGVQAELGRRNAALPERRRMEFRIGINLGDVLVDGEQIYGDEVNIAARLEGLADAGAISVSGSVFDHVRAKVPWRFDDLGRQRVKGMPGRVRVYGVDYAEGSRERALARRRRQQLAAGLVAVAVIGAAAGWFVTARAPQPELPVPPPDLQVLRDCDGCPELAVVPAGAYLMGSAAGSALHLPDQGPQHRVAIPRAFAAGRYEVTFAQWDTCVAAGGCEQQPNDRDWGRGNRPVIYVSWEDARAFTAWLSAKTGLRYRLPSESEWEYMARAGAASDFWWGNRPAVALAACGDCGGEGEMTAPVGSFPPNPFGLYDTHGNVWEWTEDCWNGSYAGAPADGSAWTMGECDKRVVRGGSWGRPAAEMRLAFREGDNRQLRSGKRGFRVVRDLD